MKKTAVAVQDRSTVGRFKPYPAYKDSGVEWLGEIPGHWEAKRLKRLSHEVNGSTPASGAPAFWDGAIPWVTREDLGELNGAAITSTRRNITEAGYRSCLPCGGASRGTGRTTNASLMPC